MKTGVQHWAAEFASHAYNVLFPGDLMLRRAILFVLCLCVYATAQTQSTPNEKQTQLRAKFEESIRDVDSRLDGVMGVAILDLTNGDTILFHADEVFPTASSIKVAIVAELFRQDEA